MLSGLLLRFRPTLNTAGRGALGNPTRGAVWVQRTSCPAGPSCPWAPIPPPQCSFPGGAQRRTLRRNIVLGTSCTTQWNEKAGQRSTFHRRQTRGDVAVGEDCIAVHTAHLGVVCGVFAWCGVMSVVGWGVMWWEQMRRWRGGGGREAHDVHFAHGMLGWRRNACRVRCRFVCGGGVGIVREGWLQDDGQCPKR